MILADGALLEALRGRQSVAEVCRAGGITEAEFAAARDAYLRRSLPPTNASIRAGVGAAVEIIRDRAGVPHIYAQSTADLYFGLGFVMAQDRLWQMDRMRRRALGRQAEVLGNTYVKSDLAHLLVGVPEIAAAEVERTDGPTRLILEAFVRGINRQIEEAGPNLPVEFAILDYAPEPFTLRDIHAILRGMWWSLNGRIEGLVVSEAARLLSDAALQQAFLTPEAPEERIVPPGSPYPNVPGGSDVSDRVGGAAGRLPLDALNTPVALVAGMGDGTGSNNWAVAGSHSASGRAVLCSDPHQGFWLPSSWYEYALHGPEEDVAGAGHPGIPGIWWGSNGQIAWGLTNNGASTRDLYEETVDPANPGRYRDGDTWRPFTEREVHIPVRGQDAERVTLRSTVRGPIMNPVLPALAEGGDPPLALRWIGQEHLEEITALVKIGRAQDWPAFRAALRHWSIPVFNFGYADATGFVGYQSAGRIPVRSRVARGFREASNPDDTWQGYVPFDGLPRLENPPRGYIASANNRVAPDDYPYTFYGAWAGGQRADRLKQALETERAVPVTREASVALQNDVKSCRAERLCPPLLRQLSAAARDDADVRLFCETLAAWDYHYALDSVAPVFFESFMPAWQARVAQERFPDRLVALVKGQAGVATRLIEFGQPAWFEGGDAALQSALVETARRAVARVRARYGSDPAAWTWGAAHQAYWKHAISNEALSPASDVGPAPVGGCVDTICNTGTGPDFEASSGAEYRLVVDFSKPQRFWATQNAGNSGQPGSPHYADQFDPWRRGEYHLVSLRREDVARDPESRITLSPG